MIKDTPSSEQVKAEAKIEQALAAGLAGGGSVEELLAAYEEALAGEGMPAELAPLAEEFVEERGEEFEDEESFGPRKRVENVGAADGYFEPEPADDGSPSRAAERPALTLGDEQVLERIRERGWAATLDEAGVHSAEQLERLADANAAYLMAGGPDGRRTVIGMAGATRGDVERAAERAEAERLSDRFEETVEEARRGAAAVDARLRRLGGACSEGELVGSLLGRFHRGTVSALLTALAEGGGIRQVRSRSTGVRIVAFADASREALTGAAKTVARCARESARNVRLKGKVFARGASGSRPEEGSPADAAAELARGWAEFLAARRRALSTPLPADRLRWTDTGLVCSFDRAARGERAAAPREASAPLTAAQAERAAWSTARALRVSRMPSVAHRMLHHVRCAGGWVPLCELGARYGAALADERGLADRRRALRQALAELRGAGRVRVARNRADGRLYARAVRPVDRRGEEGALLAIMAAPESGIPIPEGTRLARRVAGVRQAAERRAAAGNAVPRVEPEMVEPAA
jgi:hypothetical protein